LQTDARELWIKSTDEEIRNHKSEFIAIHLQNYLLAKHPKEFIQELIEFVVVYQFVLKYTKTFK
jgi:hypothetical protein